MWRQDYHFDLPDRLIAGRPPALRGESRLMCVPTEGEPRIGPFATLLESFRGDELLVLNDTRVVPARVRGHKQTGGAVELFFVESLPGDGAGEGARVVAMLRGKRLQIGARLVLPGTSGVVTAARGEGLFEVELPGITNVWSWLETVGEVPLPPYLDRPADADDRDRYQTVFAREPGAVAAPTAGLHFTPALLDALRARGVTVATVTLHVGLGTFLPVRVEDLDKHVMHLENFVIPEATRRHLEVDRPIVAVGTTVVRALESYALDHRATSSQLFIRPGFQFQLVDGLLTNFHLPESTLLMLVSAFVGRERLLEAYRAAIEHEMRFFSYGDAMLLRRPGGRWT